jgi:hypothetical protein
MSKKDVGLMTVGDAAKGLGVDKKTIGSWLERFSEYFTTSARGDDGRLMRHIDDQDFLVLNTIRGLTQGMPNNAKDWNVVAERLAEGYRDHNFPPAAATVRSVVAPLAQAMKVAESEAQKESALARLDEVRQTYEKRLSEKENQIAQLNEKIEQIEANAAVERQRLETQTAAEKEKLLRELADLRQKLGESDSELRLWRAGRIKPEG